MKYSLKKRCFSSVKMLVRNQTVYFLLICLMEHANIIMYILRKPSPVFTSRQSGES